MAGGEEVERGIEVGGMYVRVESEMAKWHRIEYRSIEGLHVPEVLGTRDFVPCTWCVVYPAHRDGQLHTLSSEPCDLSVWFEVCSLYLHTD